MTDSVKFLLTKIQKKSDHSELCLCVAVTIRLNPFKTNKRKIKKEKYKNLHLYSVVNNLKCSSFTS